MALSLPSTDTVAMVVTPDGRLLSVRPDDRLWLLRAVESEGQPYDLVAQTLVNRWAFLAAQHPGLYPSLKDLVRAYAQPVNPAWFPDGKKHLAALARGQDTVARAEKRRDRHSTLDVFSPVTEAAVQRALYGPLTLPRGAVHYSVPRATPEWKAVEIVPGVRGRTNAIYSAPGRAARKALYSIPGRSRGRGTKGSAALWALVLVGGLFGALVAFRANKKGALVERPSVGPDQETLSVPPTLNSHRRKEETTIGTL